MITDYVVDVVAAFSAANKFDASELPALLQAVYGSFARLSGQSVSSKKSKPKPAVPINKSVCGTHLICLEDGLHYITLKRHLKTAHKMTPQEYIRKWNLPSDYPLVAPGYSKQRSKLAKSHMFGTKAWAERRHTRNASHLSVTQAPAKPEAADIELAVPRRKLRQEG